ncbi:PilW family protein [Endothiovibrio diazotrophicus]
MNGHPRHPAGFTLTEILVALAIGSLVLLGITSLFVNSSDSNRKLSLAGELIENGRFALDLLFDDVRHAGFYGPLSNALPTPGSLPDPCDASAPAPSRTHSPSTSRATARRT